MGEGVNRGGNEEGVGLGDRFAQHIDQRVVDNLVLDASGSEEKLHKFYQI
jgi:GTPase involved in cell partitioning and DNA repair